MTWKKKTGGTPPKDVSLMEGFNPIPRRDPVTGRILPVGPRISKGTARRKEKKVLERKANIDKELATIGDILRPPVEGGVPLGEEEAESIEEEVTPGGLTSAYKMLQDMRWVYQNCKVDGKTGRSRLEKLMKSDKEFMAMIKELMKIESALLAARIRRDGDMPGGCGGQGFFVILKGLDTDEGLLKQVGDGTVDLRQVEHILDPSAGKYEAEPLKKEEALPETPKEG